MWSLTSRQRAGSQGRAQMTRDRVHSTATSGTGGPRCSARSSTRPRHLTASRCSVNYSLSKKKINGGNPAVPGNDEISTSVYWRHISTEADSIRGNSRDNRSIGHLLVSSVREFE